VRALAEDLDRRGIWSKPRRLSNGRTIGGGRLGVGALAHLLKNRFYIGEVVYRLEIPFSRRPTKDRCGTARTDPAHERRKSHTFHPADFTIRPDGVCRLNPEMAGHVVRLVIEELKANHLRSSFFQMPASRLKSGHG
jgi:hypothetical protein